MAAQRARQEAICQYVLDAGARTVEEIVQATGVSAMTVYRDLAALERVDLLHLHRGVVTAAASSLHEASSRYRRGQQTAAKAALARAALELVEPGSSLFLDDSTTGLALAALLPEKAPLTVITNYQPVCRELEQEPQIDLWVTGGQYVVWADALMGPMALQSIRGLNANACFMSSSAVTAGQCFHPAREAAEVKRAMLERSQARYLYVDHTKFARTALHAFADLADFDAVIVDGGAGPAVVAELRRTVPRVIQAKA
ncbi:MAG: DeoR/GlpR family DNA-binding transcription regulator [Propionibacteriaceae bacterium]|nr:DeoR/GlpR family DNA-binding transcription regulator [Propionibacteriaceae bacterium]